ncbi:MAG: polysaccharide biosynthesis protein [Prevotella sp.]|nr:polysaccharide biosynthesis protein [Prevotella sp.]
MMSDESLQTSKRIASNTLALFTRTFVILFINLYAVRLALKALGDTDYGIFNLIAGIILLSSFLTSTLAVAFQRFYSYALGRKDHERVRDYFSAGVNITLAASLLILIVFETIGLYFVCTQLRYPPEKLTTIIFIYQFALLSFLCSLNQIPYTAALFANEDIKTYTVISVLECLGKLSIAIIITYVPFHRLFFYGFGLTTVAALVFLLYLIICRHRYAECHYRRVRSLPIHKELLTFSGWTMYGTMSGIAMLQGSAILLNIFFGPIINAAYGIATQVYNAANAMCNSIILAFRPSMVKSYAEDNHAFLNQLFTMSNKSILYILLCIAVPAITVMDTVFRLWLESIPDYSVLFARLFIVYLVLISLNHPITTIIQSTGRVRNYYLSVDSITLLSLPIAWLLFRQGYSPASLFLAMIGVCLLAHVVRIVCLQHYYGSFRLSSYLAGFLLPGLFVAAISSLYALFAARLVGNEMLRLLLVCATSPLVTLLLAFAIGTTKTEKAMLTDYCKKLLRR